MNTYIAGVDEVGRGPLAGPVVAAAVILSPHQPIEGLRDSKKLSAKQREYLAKLIKSQAVAWGIGEADPQEIDQINILQASLRAMERAVAQLTCLPHQVLVDGKQCPNLAMACKAIVGGDDLEPCISAASILAKVVRDDYMTQIALKYPEYGFERHKGYGTKVHLAALQQYGPCAIHRLSFAPVKRIVDKR